VEAVAEQVPPPETDRQASLLRYLDELAEFLPESDRRGFLRSDARLKIEYIKAKLQGKVGILQQIESQYAPPPALSPSGTFARSDELSMDKIAETFAYIGSLAAHHPDRNVGTMLQSKVNGILQRIRG
jgi:hypothetical protein